MSTPQYLDDATRAYAEQAAADHDATARRRIAEADEAQAILEQLAADERAALDAVPLDDEVDADEAVRALEERIASGDPDVGAEQLTAERTAAAGRVRFARLRRLADDRRARREAEQAERDRAAAAEQAARDALAPHSAAAVARAYDAAVDALGALLAVCEGRRDTIRRLTGTLPGAVPLSVDGRADPDGRPDPNAFRVDGALYEVHDADPGSVVALALANARVSVRGPVGVVDPDRIAQRQVAIDMRIPAIVATGRAQLERDRPDGAA